MSTHITKTVKEYEYDEFGAVSKETVTVTETYENDTVDSDVKSNPESEAAEPEKLGTFDWAKYVKTAGDWPKTFTSTFNVSAPDKTADYLEKIFNEVAAKAVDRYYRQ